MLAERLRKGNSSADVTALVMFDSRALGFGGGEEVSIREGAKELVSGRVSARGNPCGGNGAGSGSGVRRSLCSDSGLCGEGGGARIPRGRTFWTCRVPRYRSSVTQPAQEGIGGVINL